MKLWLVVLHRPIIWISTATLGISDAVGWIASSSTAWLFDITSIQSAGCWPHIPSSLWKILLVSGIIAWIPPVLHRIEQLRLLSDRALGILVLSSSFLWRQLILTFMLILSSSMHFHITFMLSILFSFAACNQAIVCRLWPSTWHQVSIDVLRIAYHWFVLFIAVFNWLLAIVVKLLSIFVDLWRVMSVLLGSYARDIAAIVHKVLIDVWKPRVVNRRYHLRSC